MLTMLFRPDWASLRPWGGAGNVDPTKALGRPDGASTGLGEAIGRSRCSPITRRRAGAQLGPQPRLRDLRPGAPVCGGEATPARPRNKPRPPALTPHAGHGPAEVSYLRKVAALWREAGGGGCRAIAGVHAGLAHNEGGVHELAGGGEGS